MVFEPHLLEAVLEAVLEGKDGSPSDEEAELTDMARFFLSVYDTLIIIICPICSAFGRPLPFPAVFYWSRCASSHSICPPSLCMIVVLSNNNLSLEDQ